MRKIMGIYVVAAMVLVCVSGCAVSQIEAFKDPQFAGKSYKNIVVTGQFSDLGERKSAEYDFCAAFREQGINCVASLDLILPTRTYSAEEKAKILKDNGIDAELVVSFKDAYEKQQYVPGKSSTNCRKDAYGNMHCDTNNSAGYTVSKPRLKCECTLIDVEKNSNAWVASSLTAGNAYADFNTMMSSLAKETLTKLSSDGLVIMAPKPQK